MWRRFVVVWGVCCVLSLVAGWVLWFLPMSLGARRLYTAQIPATTSGPPRMHAYWAAARWFDIERGWHPMQDGDSFAERMWGIDPPWEDGWWVAVDGTPPRIAHRRQAWGLFGSTRDWFEELGRRAFARGKLFESSQEPFDLFPSEVGSERAVGWPLLSHTARWQARGGVVSSERSVEFPGDFVHRLPERWQWYQFPIGIIWTGVIGNSLVYAVLVWAPVRLAARGRELSRYRRGVCPRCRYDLRRDYSRGCPECGWGRV